MNSTVKIIADTSQTTVLELKTAQGDKNEVLWTFTVTKAFPEMINKQSAVQVTAEIIKTSSSEEDKGNFTKIGEPTQTFTDTNRITRSSSKKGTSTVKVKVEPDASSWKAGISHKYRQYAKKSRGAITMTHSTLSPLIKIESNCSTELTTRENTTVRNVMDDETMNPPTLTWEKFLVKKTLKSEVECLVCYTSEGPFFRMSHCPVSMDHSTELHLVCSECKERGKVFHMAKGNISQCHVCRKKHKSYWMIRYDEVPKPGAPQITARKKTIAKKRTLELQTRVPTKTYSCIWCNRSFLYRSSLAAHKKTHYRKKRCKFCGNENCDTCKKLGKLPLYGVRKCRNCDKEFSSPQKLRQHLLGVRSVCQVCTHCYEFFGTKSLILSHKCPRLPNIINKTVVGSPPKSIERKPNATRKKEKTKYL